jgi:sugar phosphate isomerase/epimerase
MQILYFSPFWGSEHLGLQSFFKRVVNTGFDGVEIAIPIDKKFSSELKSLLDDTGIKLIGHQHLAPKKESVKEYLNRLEDFLGYLINFNPLFINSHTGRDFFSFEGNCMAIDLVNKISKDSGIKIIHETHRGRFNFSTYTTKLYFQKYSDLKITADFSHWCCVSESLLEDQEEFLEEAFQRTEHIHARVGYSQSPQVNHPGAPENKYALERHMAWWKEIINLRKKEQRDYFPITTEFGPVPYMPTSPFDNIPLSDQWELNLFMKEYLRNNL